MMCCQLVKSNSSYGKKKIKLFICKTVQHSTIKLIVSTLLLDESVLSESKTGSLEDEPIKVVSKRVNDLKQVFPLFMFDIDIIFQNSTQCNNGKQTRNINYVIHSSSHFLFISFIVPSNISFDKMYFIGCLRREICTKDPLSIHSPFQASKSRKYKSFKAT